jgi:prepilin-type N-terminal cleavage/methylation domain-containing protein
MIHTRPTQGPRGFTLVELLVVMAIIALVISILLPALGGARNAAKTATTTSLASDIVKASESFQLDNRRIAGRFTAREMGDKDNATRGLSGMENLLLDLAGGVVGEGTTQPTQYPKSISICPIDPSGGKADPVWVDPGLIGAQGVGGKSYYLPQAKFYVAQLNPGTGADIGQFGVDGPTGKTEADPQLPDVVDAWGNPLLVWTEDEGSPSVTTDVAKFAAIDSTNSAHFYWNQNAAFLKATAMGRARLDQTKSNAATKYSMIGFNVAPADIQANMAVLLGNPNLPTDLSKDPVLPTAGRGRVLIQSAGVDGYFMGKRDRGARRIAGNSDKLAFAMNYYKTDKAQKTDRLKDRDGKESTFDQKDDFDDVLLAGGS